MTEYRTPSGKRCYWSGDGHCRFPGMFLDHCGSGGHHHDCHDELGWHGPPTREAAEATAAYEDMVAFLQRVATGEERLEYQPWPEDLIEHHGREFSRAIRRGRTVHTAPGPEAPRIRAVIERELEGVSLEWGHDDGWLTVRLASRHCAHCRQRFSPKRDNARCCSGRCRSALHRAAKRSATS